jgi:lipopolysaccharide export LptBFGC system permease protein LptF
MEVHHHPDLNHKRKKIKEYFLEFLMIFLAVFLGFIAENVRENLSERAKEKEYIFSFIEDLEADTANLHEQIPLMKSSIRGLDTLINQTYLYLEGKGDTRLMYYTYHHDCRAVFNLELSQRTINQLKNSGNMRLIHDRNAANIISDAEVGFEILNQRTNFYRTRQEDATSFGLKIFDFKEYQKANANKNGSVNTNDEGFLLLTYSPPLNTTDPAYLKEFASRVGYYRNAFDIYMSVSLIRRFPK